MATKANIYTEKNSVRDSELLAKLREAIDELEYQMRATVPISKANCRIGWGVSKAKRGIAADAVISIARAIKALKGW